MQCPYCKYPDSRVVDTIRHVANEHIDRRRECVKCGIRFNTRENLRANKQINDDRFPHGKPGGAPYV